MKVETHTTEGDVQLWLKAEDPIEQAVLDFMTDALNRGQTLKANKGTDWARMVIQK